MGNLIPRFLFCLWLSVFCFAQVAHADELQDQINAKKTEVKQLQGKIDTYNQAIIAKQKDISTLKGQLDLIQTRIDRTNLEIKSANLQIDTTNAELKILGLGITNKEIDITKRREWIASLLRALQRNDAVDYMQGVVGGQSISDVISHSQNIADMQKNLVSALSELETAKKDLEVKKTEQEKKKASLVNLKNQLSSKQFALEGDKGRKSTLLSETKSSEKKFQSLLADLKAQSRKTESEIYSLEEAMRAKLSKEGKLKSLGDFSVMWPVPSQIVTARFHDKDYPFRNVFEHPGTDIRAPQGTSVKAASTGYVGQARNAGMGYSYILLIHQNGYSTLYGHISKILVKQGDLVQQGQVIGLSGGTPGTPGAGPFVTGAHLHFEIRKDGIPVNAENYLP